MNKAFKEFVKDNWKWGLTMLLGATIAINSFRNKVDGLSEDMKEVKGNLNTLNTYKTQSEIRDQYIADTLVDIKDKVDRINNKMRRS